MNFFGVKVILFAIFFANYSVGVAEVDEQRSVQARDKRALYFPYNSCIALAIVLAIPLTLKGRNVYMSYNFEVNYYMPYFDTGQGLVPLPFATIDEPGVNDGTFNDPNRQRNLDETIESSTDVTSIEQNTVANVNATITNIETNNKSSAEQTHKTHKRNARRERFLLDTLLSRKKLYKVLIDKMDKAGFNGEECLFRAICEAAEQPFGDHNGVVGDIFHIIFSPSSSRSEKLSIDYYEAEQDGQNGRCHRYKTLCSFGILELITQTTVQ